MKTLKEYSTILNSRKLRGREKKWLNKISRFIANILPNRVMLWAIVRAFGYTSSHECSNKTPEEIGYSDLYKSWENKINF